MNEAAAMVPTDGYNRPENSGMAQRTSAAASATARAELEAQCGMARLYPRDELKALTAMVTAAKRIDFAESATYSFPRGGQNVSGPSVSLARPVATYWGHIRYGFKIVDDDDEEMGLEGFAHDLQTGTYYTLPDRFKKLVQRKGKGWVRPDERDLRELVNKRGAILVRNCILGVVPPDIIDRVLRECEKTLDDSAAGNLKENREDTLRKLVIAWAELGVDREMVETFLGHPLDQLASKEIVTLQGMWRSIRDGNTKVSDHFEKAAATNGNGTATAKIDLSQAKEGVAVDPPGGSKVAQPSKEPPPLTEAEMSASDAAIDAKKPK